MVKEVVVKVLVMIISIWEHIYIYLTKDFFGITNIFSINKY